MVSSLWLPISNVVLIIIERMEIERSNVIFIMFSFI